MENKRISIKIWQLCIILLVLIVIVFTIILMFKGEKTNSKIEESNFEESKIVTTNENKSKNTTTIVEYDMINNIEREIELDMNDIPQDKPTGYIPDQNLVKDNFTPFSEREPEPVYNYDISNVTLEIVEGSLTKTGLIIQITDKNETKYAWGEDFLLQIKNDDGEWVFPKYIAKNSWYEVPWNLNSDGIGWQTISMNGEFEEGRQYRIVKRTYDNNKQEYVEVSVEFEI